MERTVALETTFLIDLERERLRSVTGPAHRFLIEHADTRLVITPTVAGELAAGKSLSSRDRWRAFVAPFRVLPINEDVQWKYGNTFRYLQRNGLLIAANDLWIAVTALAHGVPVLTRNVAHYERVPGLTVLGY